MIFQDTGTKGMIRLGNAPRRGAMIISGCVICFSARAASFFVGAFPTEDYLVRTLLLGNNR